MALTDKLTAIGDAIRTKTGTTEEMSLDQMANAISEIETGGGDSVQIPVAAYYSYTVESVDGASYGFALNEDGYYESQNKGQQSSYALCRVNITTTEPNTDIVFSVINYAEKSWDYGIFGNLDVPLALSASADTDIKQSYKQISESIASTLTYTVASPGNHFIDVKFIKDSSGNSNNDSVQFKIEYTPKISEEYYEILQQVEGNLNPKNIASGVSIFGVDGAHVGPCPNGTEWTKIEDKNLGFDSTSRVTHIEYHNGVYILGGSYYKNSINYSLDGRIWEKAIANVKCHSILYNDGLWLVNTGNGIYYSTDGITWNRATFNGSDRGSDLIYYNGLYIGGGTSSRYYYSPDGITWTENSSNGDIFALAVHKGTLYGKIGDGVYKSSDGMTWIQCLSGGKDSGGQLLSSDGLLLVSDGNLGLKYSTDGETWVDTNLTGASNTELDLSKVNDLWFATNSPSGLNYSIDGKVWMQSNLTNGTTDKVVGCNGIYLTTGEGYRVMYYSTDGITWSETTFSSRGTYTYIGTPAYIKDRWLASLNDYMYESVTWAPSI